MKAQRALAGNVWRLGFAVENHQPVLRAIRFALVVVLRVAVAPAQPGFGKGTQKKVVVGFPLLGPDRMFVERAGDVVTHPQLRIVGEQLGDDVLRGFILKQVAVAPVAQQCQCRFEAQPVARHAAICACPGRLSADAVPGPPVAIGKQQLDGDFFTDKGIQVEVGRGAQCINIETEQLIDALGADKLLGHQRFGQARILRGGKQDHARMLAQPGAKQADGGRHFLQAGHQLVTATSSIFRSRMPDGTYTEIDCACSIRSYMGPLLSSVK